MLPTKSPKSNISNLFSPIQFLKGVGPKKSAALGKLGIGTIHDALYYFPFRYEDRRRIFTPREITIDLDGSLVCVRASVDRVREIGNPRKKIKMLEVIARGDDGRTISATWFHSYPGMKERLEAMTETIFTGTVKFFRDRAQLVHPDFASREDHKSSLHWGRIVPIYSLTDGISQKALREIIHQSMVWAEPMIQDSLPNWLREKLQLPGLCECLWEMHYPKESPAKAEHRIIWEEFFRYQLIQKIRLKKEKKNSAIPITIWNRSAQAVRAKLPFRLTQGQEQALAEILSDLTQTEPMHRILQGDVGSGKTLVAFLSLLEVMENSYQGAILVPTETLAEQHYRNALKIFPEEWRGGIALLTGSLKKAEKQKVLDRIRSGDAKLIIGTHAILQDTVAWNKLALIVVDEQHRFGVRQRSFLRGVATRIPHLLTMSATPIPRSLAMTIFGELRISTIRERPAERQEIATKVLPGQERQKVYNLFHREVRAGRQGYLIYPLVENSEKETMAMLRSVVEEAKRLQQGPLKGLRIGVVHGKLPANERQAIMLAFAKQELDILISTTVVEVGVDVPNATVIAIENAERFGLAQLHQLRGRVGRGIHKSYCVLITDSKERAKENSLIFSDEAEPEEDSWYRLRVLERSQDGFLIAEEDLKLRGSGDLIGTKQSGVPNFRVGNLERDFEVFLSAKNELAILLERDPDLEQLEHKELRSFTQEYSAKLADILQTG